MTWRHVHIVEFNNVSGRQQFFTTVAGNILELDDQRRRMAFIPSILAPTE
ncbi:hypothetical protein [Pseudomonas fragi]|nr:hypothetical protein [Pseudomonas fragi]